MRRQMCRARAGSDAIDTFACLKGFPACPYLLFCHLVAHTATQLLSYSTVKPENALTGDGFLLRAANAFRC